MSFGKVKTKYQFYQFYIYWYFYFKQCFCFWLFFLFFLANVSIFYPVKISKNLWFSCVFRVYKNGNIGQKWVKEVYRNNSNLPTIVNSVHVFNSLFLILQQKQDLFRKSSVIDSRKISCYLRYSRYYLIQHKSVKSCK